MQYVPAGRARGCGQNAKYFFCRTWFFEVLFTLLPCALLALIIAGIYEFEQVSEQYTTQLLYEHSMSPVNVALRSFIDRKMRSLDHLTAFVENGGWADVVDFEPISLQVLPFFTRDEALRSDAAGVAASDVVQVGYFTGDTMRFTQYTNLGNEDYVESQLTYATIAGPRILIRDRFVDFARDGPGLGLFAPNTSEVAIPVNADVNPWTVADSVNPETVFSFQNLRTTTDTTVRTFGMRFAALHAATVPSGSLIVSSLLSEFFVTYNLDATFGSVLPDCSSKIHAVIYDAAGRIAYYNCHADFATDPALISDVPILQSAGLGTTSPQRYARDTTIEEFARLSGGVYYLGTVNFVTASDGSVSEGTEPWPGHNRADQAVGQRVLSLRALAPAARNFFRSRVTSIEEVDEVEDFFAGLMISTPFIQTIFHVLPNRAASIRELRTYQTTTNTAGTPVFRSMMYLPTPAHQESVTKRYVSGRLDCTNVDAALNVVKAQACVARRLIDNSTSPYMAGFDEHVLVLGLATNNITSLIPTWASNALAMIGAYNASSPIFFDRSAVAAGVITMMRLAKLPQPAATARWSAAGQPPYALLRHSYSLRELTGIMTQLMGQYASVGRTRILDRHFGIIAEAGAQDLVDAVDTVPSWLAPVVTDVLHNPCRATTSVLICDTATLTPVVFFYTVRVSPLRSYLLAFSRLATFDNTVVSTEAAEWYLVQTLPGELITTVTRQEKILAGSSIVVAVIFLVMNVIYVAWTTVSIIGLKRYMRSLAQNRPVPELALSTNTELREIQLALLKTKKAMQEYDTFLPAGLGPSGLGSDLPDELIAVQTIDRLRAQARGLAYIERDSEGNIVSTTSDAPSAVVAGPGGNHAAGAAADADGDSEMAQVFSSAASVGAAGDAPAAQPLTYDDLLITHQIGIARREMSVLSLDIVDLQRHTKKLTPGQLSAVMARVVPIFGRYVKPAGGLLLPMGAGVGTVCAVWSKSRTRNCQLLAATAAANIVNSLAQLVRREFVPVRRHTLQFSVAVAMGECDIGTIGEKDGRKTMVFAGEGFGRARAIHRHVASQLRVVGCRSAAEGGSGATPRADNRAEPDPIRGCGAAAMCDSRILAEARGPKKLIFFPQQAASGEGEDGRAWIVTVAKPPSAPPPAAAAGASSAEAKMAPEAKLAELLERALPTSVPPDSLTVRRLLQECDAASLTGCTRPLPLLRYLPES